MLVGQVRVLIEEAVVFPVVVPVEPLYGAVVFEYHFAGRLHLVHQADALPDEVGRQLLGAWMAVAYGREKKLSWILLGVGTVIPAVLIALSA